jgi:4-diphosphocytidyl-2-C-methyl-D-erythritol kinase
LSRCCTIKAPGKINLHLAVGEKRADGYHDLLSVFLSLDFGDTLTFTGLEGASPNLTALEMAGPFGRAEELSPGSNIVTRAVTLFREKTGYDRPIRVMLEKRIPLGGGLGGGSSDAASTLLALDALAETGLGAEDLRKIGEKLGSDVPFFLSGGAALVEGRGERVQSLEIPAAQLLVVLVNPGFSSGTASAFAKLDVFRAKNAKITGSHGNLQGITGLTGGGLIRFLGESPASWPYSNDFLPVLREDGEHGAVYDRIIRDLQELGADFFGLSGAGSTCFGIFREKGAAERAVNTLIQRWSFTKLTFFLAYKPKPVLQYL